MSYTDATSPGSEQSGCTREIVDAVIKAYAAGDIETMLNCCDENIVSTCNLPNALFAIEPLGPGKDSLRKAIFARSREFRRSFVDEPVCLVEGERAFIRIRWKMLHLSTMRRFEVLSTYFIQIRNGRIVEINGLTDVIPFMETMRAAAQPTSQHRVS